MPITQRDIERLREEIELQSFTVLIAEGTGPVEVGVRPGGELKVLEVSDRAIKVVPVRASTE